MSYYFTCAVVEADALAVPETCEVRLLAPGIHVVWQPDAPRVCRRNSVTALVAALTPSSPRVLHVSYDDGCGLREATVFEHGSPVRTFGETDELWVPIDESGMPVASATPLGVDELDDDVEYDCVRDGIVAALDFCYGAGRFSTTVIRDLVCRSDE